MNYKIINSGSDGNAVIINEEILIDCGVNFKKIENDYKKLKLVLLTHIHYDHFKMDTIRKLLNLRPTLRFGCCEWLKEELLNCGVEEKNIDVYELNKKYTYINLGIIEPIPLIHDVPQCGYKIIMNNQKLIYATDTKSIDHIEAKNFDVYLIEGNYESDSELQSRAENPEYYTRVKNTHLSKEQATKWLLKNMGDNSVYEFMHQHKHKKVANRFLEIEPLLKKVGEITNTEYSLNDEDLYNAMDDILNAYYELKDKINQNAEKEEYEYGE